MRNLIKMICFLILLPNNGELSGVKEIGNQNYFSTRAIKELGGEGGRRIIGEGKLGGARWAEKERRAGQGKKIEGGKREGGKESSEWAHPILQKISQLFQRESLFELTNE